MREHFDVYIGCSPRISLRARSYRFSGESTEHVDCEDRSRRDYPARGGLHENGFAQLCAIARVVEPQNLLIRNSRICWPDSVSISTHPPSHPALILLGKIVNGADTDNSLWNQPEGLGLEAMAEGFRHLG